MSRWLLILLAFTLARPASSETPFQGLEAAGTVDVDTAVDGDTVRLTDGRELRLGAVEAPRADTSPVKDDAARRATALAALVDEARAALAELAGHRTVALYFDERRNDRYGRIVAQVVVPPDRWVQADMLRRGLARVHTTPDVAASASALLRIEGEARANARGLWAFAAYRVRRPEDLRHWLDSFQLVEGRVATVRRSASQTWLDIAGLDIAGEAGGRQALEIAIPSAARKYFRAADVDLAGLMGATVRVRGWVRWQRGPVIDVDHPAQIEILKQNSETPPTLALPRKGGGK